MWYLMDTGNIVFFMQFPIGRVLFSSMSKSACEEEKQRLILSGSAEATDWDEE